MTMRRFLLPGALLLVAASCDGDRRPPSAERAAVTVKGRRIDVGLSTSEKDRRSAPPAFTAAGEDRGYLMSWPRARHVKLESEHGQAPFDVAFLDKDGKVVEIQPFVPPDREGIMSKAEAAHALFLAPGLLKKLGAGPGDAVTLPPEAAAARELPVMKIGNATAHVELALTESDRQHGLMYRPRMSADDGMLFCYDHEGQRNFWMMNTLIPLDIAFFASDGTLVNVNETPMWPNPRRAPDNYETSNSAGPARFVLEMNLGWFKRKGLTDAAGNLKPGLKAVLPPEALRGSD